MNEQLKLDIQSMLAAAADFREATNVLWDAYNPDDAVANGRTPLEVDDAQEAHSAAFYRLERCEYYLRKQLEKAENLN